MRAIRHSNRIRRLIAVVASLGALLIGAPAAAHDARTPVIVDTDAALDDLRAIMLLLNDGRARVAAVVTSDGACSPEVGAVNVRRALEFFGRKDIPVAAGRISGGLPPPWREMSEAMGWSDLPRAREETPSGSSGDAIARALLTSEGRTMYLCLGPMTNLAEALRSVPSIKDKIRAVYFYGAPPDGGTGSWNTDRDRRAAVEVAASGVPLYCCAPPDSCLVRFDVDLYRSLAGLKTPAGEFIKRLHAEARVQELLREGHFSAWDETAALCLLDPGLAAWAPRSGNGRVFEAVRFDAAAARAVYLRAAGSGGPDEAGEPHALVFRDFPADPALFEEDVSAIASDLIDHHGFEEWRAAVIASELHGHLGIYSILGVKMGIRAREIMKAGLDELEVVSGASLEPPLSCLNDGLQASTGATLGRGTISVDPSARAAEATFIKGDERLRLALKASIAARIRADIRRAIDEFGDLTPRYFEEVRRLSLVYWLELDRRDIFIETTDRAAN